MIRFGYGNMEWPGPNGSRYSGYWNNDEPHGQGVFFHENYDQYHGELKHN